MQITFSFDSLKQRNQAYRGVEAKEQVTHMQT